MGWTFPYRYTKKQMIEDRIEAWDRVKEDGVKVISKCLAHCYRGNNFSGVLWSVREFTYEKDGNVFESNRYICCDLLHFRKDDGWGYKDMSESMHPYYYSCPLKYLDMVPVANEEWRENVRKYHAESLQKRRTRRAARLV
jgi:hypothetical protein